MHFQHKEALPRDAACGPGGGPELPVTTQTPASGSGFLRPIWIIHSFSFQVTLMTHCPSSFPSPFLGSVS